MLIALDKREASTCLRLVILQESFFGTDFSRVGRENPSPSSNRTCGFPASGFPVNFTKGHTQIVSVWRLYK